MKPDFNKLMDLSHKFQISKIFFVACELDIFSHLSAKSKNISELSKVLSINARSLEIFLNGLVAIGVLRKEGDLYSNSPEAEEYLVKEKPNYRGAIFKHIHQGWEEWSDLQKTLISGKNIGGVQDFWLKENRERVNAFIWGMDNLARDLAPVVLTYLNLDGKRNMLDLGGGPGTYSITFLKSYQDLNSTIFDLPLTQEIAKENIKKNKMQKRISLRSGDFLKDDIGGGYDFIWMSHIFHSNSEEDCEFLIEKVYTSLGPSGMVGIHDFVLNKDKVSPPSAAIFGVHMLAVTEKGRTYTYEEISRWLKNAGFKDIEVMDVSEVTKLIRAEKS